MSRLVPKTLTGLLCALIVQGCAYTIPGNSQSLASVLASLGSTTNFAAFVSTGLAVTNLRNGKTARTGFLHGTAEGTNLAAVEVAVDSGAYTEATGTTNWSWPLPAGAGGFKQGRTYTLHVRARDTDGTYTDVTSITIRRGLNSDVNGDGYPDTLVGARGISGATGHAFIFYGGREGLVSQDASIADVVLQGEGGTSFGLSPVLADINGDGYADASVSSFAFSGPGSQGRAYIFYSRGANGIASTTAFSADATINGPANPLYIGTTAAAGDLNGDGYADLVFCGVGGNGACYSFHSAGAAGIATQTTATADAVFAGAGSSFGENIALGDINGDGFADLMLGADQAGSNAGETYFFLTSGAALTSRAVGAADATITGEASSRLGSTLLLADLNQDGYDDAVIQGFAAASHAGRIYVFYSAGAAGIASTAASASPIIITGESANDVFGRGLAAGDVNGDGNIDLVAGATQYDGAFANVGRSYIFYSITSLGSGNALTLSGSTLTGAVGSNISLGFSGSLKDLNADGFDDALIGSIGSAAADRVYYFRAPGGSPIASVDIGTGGSADAELTSNVANNRFGEFTAR